MNIEDAIYLIIRECDHILAHEMHGWHSEKNITTYFLCHGREEVED